MLQTDDCLDKEVRHFRHRIFFLYLLFTIVIVCKARGHPLHNASCGAQGHINLFLDRQHKQQQQHPTPDDLHHSMLGVQRRLELVSLLVVHEI